MVRSLRSLPGKERFPLSATLYGLLRLLLDTIIFCGGFTEIRRLITYYSSTRYRISFHMDWRRHLCGGRQIETFRRNTSRPCECRGPMGFMLRNGPSNCSFMPHSSSKTIASTCSSRNPNICTCWAIWPWKQQLRSSPNCRLTSKMQITTLTPLRVPTYQWSVED